MENILDRTTVSKKILLNCLVKGTKLIEDGHNLPTAPTLESPKGIFDQNQYLSIKCHIFQPDTSLNDTRRSQIFMRLIMSKTKDRISRDKFYGIYFTALSSLFKFFSNNTFSTYLKTVGIELKQLGFDEFEEYILGDDEELRMEWDEFIMSSTGESMLGLISLGVLLCATARVLHSDNHIDWDKRRFSSFCAKLHGTKEGPGAEYHVSVDASEMLNSLLDSADKMRPNLFTEMREYNEGSTGAMFRIVMINIQWYQLTNLLLITEVIIKNHPYIMLWGEVATLMVDYDLIMTNYQKWGRDFKFIKYMDPSINSSSFNTPNIKKLATIAREIAVKRGQNSFSNFKVSDKEIVLSDKLTTLIDIASNANFKWADYIRNHILPIDSNQPFYNALYEIPEKRDDDQMINRND